MSWITVLQGAMATYKVIGGRGGEREGRGGEREGRGGEEEGWRKGGKGCWDRSQIAFTDVCVLLPALQPTETHEGGPFHNPDLSVSCVQHDNQTCTYVPCHTPVTCVTPPPLSRPSSPWQGFLNKQGHGAIKRWEKRFVALKGSKLAYYHSKEVS